MVNLDTIEFHKIETKKLQMLCLTLTGIAIVIDLLAGDRLAWYNAHFLSSCMNMAAVAFFVLSIREAMSPVAKRLMLLGGFSCLWLLLLQTFDLLHIFSSEAYDTRLVDSTFFSGCLLCLPFAAVTEEKDRGLSLFGNFFGWATVALLILSGMLVLGIVPTGLQNIMRWQGTRLALMWHPILLATIFFLGMGLALARACRVRMWRVRIFMLICAVSCFAGIVLTNTRALVIMAGGVLVGFLFFLFYRPDAGVKKVALQLVITLLILLVVVSAGLHIYQVHSDYLAETDEMDASQRNESGQGSFFGNLPTFNGRTVIWDSLFQQIGERPQVLLTGTDNVAEFISEKNPFDVGHAHNSWLQALLSTGLVGFGFSLCFTWLALRNSFLLLFVKRSTMYQKTICLTLLGLMGAEFFEPYLFAVECPRGFVNIFFMLALGSITYWARCPEEEND